MLASLSKSLVKSRGNKVKKLTVQRAATKEEGAALRLHKTEVTGEMLTLRRVGYSVQYIGKTLGYPPSYVSGCIRDALQSMREEFVESLSDVKDLELQRLDELSRPYYSRALNGDEWALDRVLKIMERRARLLGIDAAAKLEHTGEVIKQYVGIDLSNV